MEEWNVKFKPAIEKLLDQNGVEQTNGISSLNYYQQKYEKSAQINGLRWSDCSWNDKTDSIREYLTEKKKFLSMVLPMYDSEYDYMEIKDGVFYGVNHVWTEAGKSEVSNDIYEVIKVFFSS